MIRGLLPFSPSDTMITAAPQRDAPAADRSAKSKQPPAPPCLAEALRRESIVGRRFSWYWCELTGSYLFLQSHIFLFFKIVLNESSADQLINEGKYRGLVF